MASSTTQTFEQLIEMKTSNIVGLFSFRTTIDEIDIIINILRRSGKYTVSITSSDIYEDEDFNMLHFRGYHVELNEIKETLRNIKTLKWNKISRSFQSPEEVESDKKIYGILDKELGFNITECPVCTDACRETLRCGHTLCMKCRVKCLNKGNKKCPMCRDKCLEMHIIEEKESDDEE